MALTGTATIRIADGKAFQALAGYLRALIDVLDDLPEGSCLDDEWIAWTGRMCELRDSADEKLRGMLDTTSRSVT